MINATAGTAPHRVPPVSEWHERFPWAGRVHGGEWRWFSFQDAEGCVFSPLERWKTRFSARRGLCCRACRSEGDLYQMGLLPGQFVMGSKPKHNCFFDIFQRLFLRPSITKAPRKCRDFHSVLIWTRRIRTVGHNDFKQVRPVRASRCLLHTYSILAAIGHADKEPCYAQGRM